MKFEEQFPELTNKDWDEGGGYMTESIKEHCISKQKVKSVLKNWAKDFKYNPEDFRKVQNVIDKLKEELGLEGK